MTKKIFAIIVFTMLVSLQTSFSQDSPSLSLKKLATLPLLENGRKMPLDTYARVKLLQFSGKSTFQKKSALEWMAKVLFNPTATISDKIFRINHPEVLTALGLPEEPRHRYNFNHLQPVINHLHQLAQASARLEEKDRSPVENELLRLYSNINMYISLSNTFQFAVQHSDFHILDPQTKKALGLDPQKEFFSFLDLFLNIDRIKSFSDVFQMKKVESWTAQEQEVFQISKNLYDWSQQFQRTPLAIFPSWSHNQEMWFSPWEALLTQIQSPAIQNEIIFLKLVTLNYLDKNQGKFDESLGLFFSSIQRRHPELLRTSHYSLEIFYNQFDPFYRSQFLYGFGLISVLLSLIFFKNVLYRTAFFLIAGAGLLHLSGIILRMIIMNRPPITNLFATFIYVSLICVLLGLILEWFNKKPLGLLLSSIAGLVLLLISNRFGAEGDSMGVLIAVLDSNFWLSTHVVCITTGYAGCCAAGIAGHVYLFQRLLKPQDQENLTNSYKAVYGILAFGLIFSFIGTVLGGIWADQSWGRFWGWDPKENGALLIVLWCAILFHARMDNLIHHLGFAVGTIFGIIVVMLAWFGINLLGVGLHSYGFTSGVANWLMGYIVFQITLVLALLFLIQRRIPLEMPEKNK